MYSVIKKVYSQINIHAQNSEPIMKLFGLFGIVNYPVFYIYWKVFSDSPYDDFSLRVIATTLCLLLALKDFWPKSIKPWLPMYWYFTVMFCLPFFVTSAFLWDPQSHSWSLNIVLALFWLIAVLDWVSFTYVLLLGIASAYIYYIFKRGEFHYSGGDLIGVLIRACLESI